jgi:hypothetical protein
VVDATHSRSGQSLRHQRASTAPKPSTSTTATATVAGRTRTRTRTRARARTTGISTDRSPHIDRTPARTGSPSRILPIPVHPRWSVPQLGPFFDAFGEQRLRASTQHLGRGLAAASGAAAETVMTMAGAPVGDGTAARAARRGGCA